MKNRLIKYLLTGVTAVLFCATVAYPCEWADPGFASQFSAAEVVFLARLTPVSKGEWNVDIQRVWKGSVPKTGKLRDSLAETDCAIGLIKGARYVVFGSRSGKAAIFNTSIVSGTRPIDDDLLRKLGIGRPPE
jgi:hypothetical protein